MSEMDDLFALARVATAPPAGARERVLARVLSSVPPGPAGGSGTPLAAGGMTPAVAGVLVFALAAALGGGIYFARTRQKVEPVAVVSVVAPLPLPEVSVIATPPPPVVSAIAIPSTPTSTSTSTSTSTGGTDSLAEEVRIIREAKAALGAGDAAGAIRKLDEHAKRFKSGKLAQEREVTRVRALCKQGLIAQAKSLYRALAKGAPSSPHLASLRASCPALEDE